MRGAVSRVDRRAFGLEDVSMVVSAAMLDRWAGSPEAERKRNGAGGAGGQVGMTTIFALA